MQDAVRAVRGNSLENVKLLENVGFVMKGGVVIKNQLSSTGAGLAD